MAHDPRLAALLDQLPPRQVYRVVGNDANTASFWGQCGSLRAAFTGDPFPALYEGTISYHGHILPARGAVRQSDALPPLSAMQALQAAAHAGILRLPSRGRIPSGSAPGASPAAGAGHPRWLSRPFRRLCPMRRAGARLVHGRMPAACRRLSPRPDPHSLLLRKDITL